MVNSGSSALYLAVELLGLEPGRRDPHLGGHVLDRHRAARPRRARAGVRRRRVRHVPDRRRRDRERRSVRGRSAILAPNLIGNCPDWDRIREIADRHDLQVIEDSCDCLGATLRGTPTGTRSDISRHQLRAVAHHHRRRHRRHGVRRRRGAGRQALLLRRWGRRSEVKIFGSKKGDKRFFSEIDGIEYDDLFIFDEVGWNFEPSEMSAAFGVVQMRKLPINLARRKRNFALLSEFFASYPDVFVLPRLTPEIETGWHMFPIMIKPESGVRRSQFQQHMEAAGVDTRMVWTGNVTRQPAFKDVPHRVAPGGLANADRVMETGLILPCNHAIDDEGIEYMCHTVDQFFDGAR